MVLLLMLGWFFRWVDRIWQCQRCPGTGSVFGDTGWKQQGRRGVLTAVEEAGERRSGRHGGCTPGCQLELAHHSNSYVEIRFFVVF